MSTCLVTGGAGFIGSHVAEYLLQDGRQVVVLDDLSGGYARNVPEGAEFVQGSVTDADLIESLFDRRSFAYVYHLAAYAAEGLSHFIRRYNYETNLIGSVNLINASVKHQAKCFVFTSSIAVYGTGQVPMVESMVPQPEDPYGISKLAVEQDLACARRMFGLDYVVFRPHNVYGERQNLGDRYRNVIGIFFNQAMQGLPCTLFGDGLQTRAFTHISEVVPAIARSAEMPQAYGEVYNLGADHAYTVLELAEMVQEVMGSRAGVVHLPARKEVKHAYSDHSKARATFGRMDGVSPCPVPLREGLERMARWARTVGPQKPSIFGAIEIERGLPPSWANALEQAG